MNLSDDDRIIPRTKLPELFSLIDENKTTFINNLKEAISIPSISNTPDHFDDVLKMQRFCKEKLEYLGATVDLLDGNDDTATNFPPVLFAHLFVNNNYKTICVYGNIDTLLPEKVENSNCSPFQLKEENGRLYGCGISDNKGPLLCWFNALQIYKISKNEIPVNIKFVIEGTSKIYSQSLYNTIQKKHNFFSDVQYIYLMIDQKVNKIPCVKYGYRGICNLSLLVSCGEKRVHSGTYGGAFNQPLIDAVKVIGSLTNKHNKIIIPNFFKDVKPITEIHMKYYEKEFYSIEYLKQDIGLKFLNHKENPLRIITHKAHLPNLTVNSFHLLTIVDKDDYASIPNKIEVKFLLRLVVNQTIEKTFKQLETYIEKQWKHFKSTNSYELKMNFGFDPWQENPLSSHYKAADKAIKTVYKISPNYICEGITIPAVSIFKNNCPASNIIVIPISDNNDNHHSHNESISIESYIKGTKLAIAYMCEVHEINNN